MVDIDWFKKINDTHGHLVGDSILKEFCNVIKETIRNYDLLARYGGEEFIILLPGVGPDNAKIVAEKIRIKTQEYLFSDGQADIHITVSIGVASVRPAYAAVNEDDFVGYADGALYQAKNSGRNKVVCHKFAREIA